MEGKTEANKQEKRLRSAGCEGREIATTYTCGLHNETVRHTAKQEHSEGNNKEETALRLTFMAAGTQLYSFRPPSQDGMCRKVTDTILMPYSFQTKPEPRGGDEPS